MTERLIQLVLTIWMLIAVAVIQRRAVNSRGGG
jgi:hypothetical protein